MINLDFNIRNPWSDRGDCIYSSTKQLNENKFVELQVDKTSDIIGFHFRLTTRQDHAGVFLSMSLLGYDAIFTMYDCRHWNSNEGRWYRAGESLGWD